MLPAAQPQVAHFGYGNQEFKLSLPSHTSILKIREPQDRMSADYFADQLRNYLKTAHLDLSNPVIIVADKTRLCGYPTHLPVLVEILKEFGLPQKTVRFIIAYGTHPRQSDEECLENYGEFYTSHSFIHHDCNNLDNFIDLGVTKQGTPIRIRKDISQASCVITMGAICHHYFAGYGGGRKLIFPGCGEREAIYANHGLFLDRTTMRLAEKCQPGILENNPLAEDLFEIALKKEADLAIHGIMNSRGKLCDIIFGYGREAYVQACAQHANSCETDAPLAPLVIASCGGYPKDINFIQTHKAIHNAAMFVQDGGTLLLFAECRDGVGSTTFLPWFEAGDFATAFTKLLSKYQGNGGTALAMMAKTQRIRIILVTDLDQKTCKKMAVEKWSVDQALNYIVSLTVPVTVIPNASLLVKKHSL